MAEYIACRNCDSSNCKGCNIYTLAMMLYGGKFDCIVGDSHSINPLADVAEVVRCKDCEHYELDACLKIYQDGNVSNDAWQERKPTDFCSYGEPRGERKE